MRNQGILFWQPKTDLLRLTLSIKNGNYLVTILNYAIWPFLFFISFLLIKHHANLFWQILIATVLGEIVEKVIKRRIFWRRPLFVRRDDVPRGLVKKWYETGSFPSGHTTKAVYFFLTLLQSPVFSPLVYLLITIPLIIFRVIIGFHYPIDILGGTIIGVLCFLLVHQLVFPVFLVNLVHIIFNFVFFIR